VRIYVASHNADKVAEIRDVLRGLGVEILSAADVPGSEPPEETGRTLGENALLKARTLFRLIGEPSLADDTGLEVDALGGRPGVRSSRYAGAGATYRDNVLKLIDEMKDVEEPLRGARFRTAAALVLRSGVEILAEGVCEGLILSEPRGRGGFGYDPVFFLPEVGKTFAEMELSEKGAFSHRGRAFRRIRELLARYLASEDPTVKPA
jgi:XTP/dITP diphosphohydrolase